MASLRYIQCCFAVGAFAAVICLPLQAVAQVVECRLTLTPDLLIGRIDGSEHETFGSLVDIAIDNSRHIYALDATNKVVRVFDPQGRYVRSIGRAGRGPGEFVTPYRLAVGAAHLYVFDRTGLILVFRTDGSFERSFPLIMAPESQPFFAADDNYLWVAGKLPHDSTTQGRVLHRMDVNTGKLASFGSTFYPRSTRDWMYFATGPLAVSPAGHILFLPLAAYELHVYDRRGHLLRREPLDGEFDYKLNHAFIIMREQRGLVSVSPDPNRAFNIGLAILSNNDRVMIVRDVPLHRIVASRIASSGEVRLRLSVDLDTRLARVDHLGYTYGIRSDEGFDQIARYNTIKFFGLEDVKC